MAADKSTYLADKVIKHVFGLEAFTMPSNLYLALYTTDPTPDNTGNEVSGGSYARQSITPSYVSTGQIDNSNSITFNNMPAAAVSHWAIFDAASGGNMLYHGPMAGVITTTAGYNLPINANNLIIQEA